MPIRPEMRDRYPADWPEISQRIRFDRAAGRCECDGRCGLDHGGARCPELDGEPHSVTGSTVVLTVAHLNHVPEESGDENLMALCQRCHLAHDRPEHQRIARLRRARERIANARNGELFGVLEPQPARPPLAHFWRLRKRLPERFGQRCRIIARGSMNSIEIEFEDGVRHIVSRYAVRRRRA